MAAQEPTAVPALLAAVRGVEAQAEQVYEVDEAGSHHLAGVRIPPSPYLELVGAATLVERRLAGPPCTCEWVDDGGPESGPHLALERLDPDCPNPEHRKAWREGEEEGLRYTLALIDSRRRQAEERAQDSTLGREAEAAHRAQAEAYAEVLELFREEEPERELEAELRPELPRGSRA